MSFVPEYQKKNFLYTRTKQNNFPPFSLIPEGCNRNHREIKPHQTGPFKIYLNVCLLEEKSLHYTEPNDQNWYGITQNYELTE